LICEKEGVKVESESVFDTLVEISAGDLRRSINTLQTASAFKSQMLRAKDIQSISGVVPHDVVQKVD
jgi:DNA polymerase III delta prime subunit